MEIGPSHLLVGDANLQLKERAKVAYSSMEKAKRQQIRSVRLRRDM